MASMAIGSVFAGNPAPLNPYLADSNNPIGHNNSAQQTSVPGEGPTSPSRVLDPYQDVTWLASGTFQFGQPTSGPYPDDRRVLWGSGIDRIVKIDYETHDVLSIYKLPGRDYLNMGMGLEVFENRTYALTALIKDGLSQSLPSEKLLMKSQIASLSASFLTR